MRKHCRDCNKPVTKETLGKKGKGVNGQQLYHSTCKACCAAATREHGKTGRKKNQNSYLEPRHPELTDLAVRVASMSLVVAD